jgi:hypothetical protein
MTDFDFEELDKAVSGALGKKDTPSDDTVEPVIAAEPAIQATEPVVDPVAVPPAPTAAPAIRRTSGRFMDMVHPTSDMRIRPGSGSVRPQAVAAPSSAWAEPQPVTESVAVESAPVEPRDSIEEILKPLESPFLPDTKVEKRPLGGLSSLSQFDTSQLLEDPDLLLLDEPDDPRIEGTTMPDPIDFAVENGHVDFNDAADGSTEATEPSFVQESEEEPVQQAPIQQEPDAFMHPEDAPHEDLGNTQLTQFEAETPVATNDELFEAAETPEAIVAPQPLETIDTVESSERNETPVGPTSITQQYQEQQTTPTESGAIFDTEAYHQPLANPVKKKSGVWIIIWILVLIVLGAGAGAAFYIYVLPML